MGSNRIDGIRVKDYGLDTLETVTALQVQRYLGRLDVTSARKLLRAIIGGRMNKNTTIVNGQQLVELINLAAGSFRDQMEERILIAGLGEDAARIIGKALEGMERIDGELAVQNITVGFLEFLADCYEVLE